MSDTLPDIKVSLAIVESDEMATLIAKRLKELEWKPAFFPRGWLVPFLFGFGLAFLAALGGLVVALVKP